MRTPPRRIPLFWPTSLIVAFAALLAATSRGVAAPASPPGPDRYDIQIIEYTAYDWLLAAFKNNEIVCEIVVDYEGRPALADTYIDCGQKITDKWIAQQPCLDPSKPKFCDGYYLYFTGSRPAKKEVPVELPPPAVWLDLEDCTPVSSLSTSLCEYIPSLRLTGNEPLQGHSILRIEGRLNGASFSCASDMCVAPLEVTPASGVPIEFWAFSSYGDSSLKFTGTVRVSKADFGNPDGDSWYVDVLSSQWKGIALASCAGTWGIFPPVGGPPAWLATPNDVGSLATNIPYNYLAANLIRQGVVDVSACSDSGLNVDGLTASTCGLTAARDAVFDWQNRFDGLILDVAHESSVPAQLLKNLFARESQFWPGVILTGGDTGLGQITDKGADTTLLWNPSFYNQFCPLVLTQDACGKNYLDLDQKQQEMLRYALVNSVNATCADCPLGIDLNRADFSVKVFAQTLVANCDQASQVVWNYNGKKTPGQLGITYDDMWKFTLANYNAGGGCLASAFEEASLKHEPLTWDRISLYLAPACQGAVDYVNDISQ